MPQGSTLLQLLRGLNKDELQAIARRCEWCRVRKTDVPVQELSKRIRESIDNNVNRGNITYTDAMQDIRDEVLTPGPDPVTTKIRTILRTVPPAKHIGEIRIEEEWFSAQVYGALWANLHGPYTVHLEHQLNSRSRPTADIYVESHHNDGDYLIEMKLAKSDAGDENSPKIRGSDIKTQLRKYHRIIEEDNGRKRERTFLCIIGEDKEAYSQDVSRKSQPVSEYIDGVSATVDDIPDEFDRTEVVSNTRY
ncbi:hypothetical protein ACLI4Y_13150 [Natrialbaceae archaeon A-CW3]